MDTPVSGAPRAILRMEGVVILLAAVVAYHAIGWSWTTFALFLLVPDLGLLGYVAGPRVGAYTYNTVHNYLAPALIGLLAYLNVWPNAWGWALIWLAHIGMDRSLGIGLKFTSGFNLTHLGMVGRSRA